MGINEKLNKVQIELNAPKNLYNKFGKYYYRNAEGILEGLKPLLEKYQLTIRLIDKVEPVGDRFYVVATAILTDAETGEFVQAQAYAREQDDQAGMTEAQITGSCSSYARKYALNGLLAIDDVKDDDDRPREEPAPQTQAPAQQGNKQTYTGRTYQEPTGKTVVDLRQQVYGGGKR